MMGLSYYLISFDYEFETYIWNSEECCYIGEKTGNKLKCPCTFSYNHKYSNTIPEGWENV